jgi:hypothetical protein
MKRLLSPQEKLMANRLSQCRFLPGSYDKRFCSALPVDAEYTEKQIAFIHKCFTKYRRQIADYQQIVNMGADATPNQPPLF